MSKLKKSVEELVAQAKTFESEIYVGFCVLIIVYLITSAIRRARSNFPPGPRGWPLIGYLPYVSENSFFDFLELGKKYGDVFSIRLGTETIVVLHGFEAIKEALGKNEFLGRPSEGPLKLFNEGSPFFVGDVHLWKEQRRFVVQSMKDLGLGKTKIEGDIMDEINHFLEVLRSHKGKPIDLKGPLSPSISNNICTLVFGKRYEYHDPDRIYLDENFETANEAFSQTSAFGFFPWLRHIPFFIKFLKIEGAIGAFRNMREFFKKEIKKHRDTFDSRHIRDFIDSFFVEMESRQMKDPNTTFTDDTLVSNVVDLFSAGSETVRTAILWCIYVLAAFPNSQKKILQEILDIMGPDRDPNFQDMRRMPYTHSFILEVMRWQTIVPLNVVRITTTDTTVGGYDIPKNTMVLSNIWNIHHSPKYWEDPNSFKPERFITKDGTSVSKPSYYMPFSMGKRICPGETMATMEMFLYFIAIIQKFEVAFPEGVKTTFKARLGGTYRLDTYKIRFLPRS